MNSSSSTGPSQPVFSIRDLLGMWDRGEWDTLENLTPRNSNRLVMGLKARDKGPVARIRKFRGGANV